MPLGGDCNVFGNDIIVTLFQIIHTIQFNYSLCTLTISFFLALSPSSNTLSDDPIQSQFHQIVNDLNCMADIRVDCAFGHKLKKKMIVNKKTLNSIMTKMDIFDVQHYI